MRQREDPLVVYSTAETKKSLGWMNDLLAPFCGIDWQLTGPEFRSLGKSLSFRAIALPESVAFQFRRKDSGATALIAPAVGEITPELREAVGDSSVVLFDGTFWSNHELQALRPGARTARAMHHLPIREESLDFLRQSEAHRRIFLHVNNTNPILMPGSRERRQVEEAGLEIACDGLEIAL
jgi:pyrroloquinoline quinone biosynthesis protein B